MTSARECAFRVLLEVERDKAYVNLALQRCLRQHHLAPRDKGLCTEIVYGTVQRQRTLDALLSLYSKRKVSGLEPEVLTALRMSLYQLEFLEKVPAYAVLDEAVKLTKVERHAAAGFVNGVLRSYLRDGRSREKKLAAVSQTTEADRLGVEFSYPSWLVRRWESLYGSEQSKRLMEVSNRPSPLSLRVNTTKCSREEVLREIVEEFGDVAQPSRVSPVGIRLTKGMDIEKWTFYQTGNVSVQDEGAMLIAPLLRTTGIPENGKFLDMCAAPGSKTTHLAELFPKGQIMAADVHAHKVNLIQQALVRTEAGDVQTMTADGRLLPQFPQYRKAFNGVLVDAPCSGLGVLRHRPDIRWRRQEADIAALHDLQVQLLSAAVELTQAGGVVVYSTCTLLPEENENVVAEVVDRFGTRLTLESIVGELPVELCSRENTYGVTLTPDLLDTDGFFMTRLRVH